MKTIAEEYAVVCNKVLVEFCKWLDIEKDFDVWRVSYPEYPPHTAYMCDMFRAIEDMVTALIYKIPPEICIDWNWDQIKEWRKFLTLLNYYKAQDKSDLKLN